MIMDSCETGTNMSANNYLQQRQTAANLYESYNMKLFRFCTINWKKIKELDRLEEENYMHFANIMKSYWYRINHIMFDGTDMSWIPSDVQ